jgi:hypothetical protein
MCTPVRYAVLPLDCYCNSGVSSQLKGNALALVKSNGNRLPIEPSTRPASSASGFSGSGAVRAGHAQAHFLPASLPASAGQLCSAQLWLCTRST